MGIRESYDGFREYLGGTSRNVREYADRFADGFILASELFTRVMRERDSSLIKIIREYYGEAKKNEENRIRRKGHLREIKISRYSWNAEAKAKADLYNFLEETDGWTTEDEKEADEELQKRKSHYVSKKNDAIEVEYSEIVLGTGDVMGHLAEEHIHKLTIREKWNLHKEKVKLRKHGKR